ncbi:hypothetical protein CR513_09888, partial [Mucuna pruriens]
MHRPNTSYRDTITTIFGDDTLGGAIKSIRKRHIKAIMAIQGNTPYLRDLVICLSNEDYEGIPPHQDDPMVISLIVANYKIERALIDQGSSANVHYWSTFQKLRLLAANLEECLGTLFGFVGEVGASARTVLVFYTFVNTWAAYNMIIGRPTLNRLRVVVSTPHLCMKYLIGKEPKDRRPWLAEDLKEVLISPSRTHRTRIGTILDGESKEQLVHFLIRIWDVFAWTPTDMSRIDPNFLCHPLFIALGTRPVA